MSTALDALLAKHHLDLTSTLLSVLGLGGFRVATGAITIAQLVTFIIFLFMMVVPLGQAFGTRGVGVDDEDAGFTHGGGL